MYQPTNQQNTNPIPSRTSSSYNPNNNNIQQPYHNQQPYQSQDSYHPQYANNYQRPYPDDYSQFYPNAGYPTHSQPTGNVPYYQQPTSVHSPYPNTTANQQYDIFYQNQYTQAYSKPQLLTASSAVPPPSVISPNNTRIDTSLPLSELREQVKGSKDPLVHLDYIRFLVSTADDLLLNDPQKKGMARDVDQLFTEALKLCKKLAASGPGGINNLGKTPPCAAAQECYGNGLLGLSIDHDKAYTYYHQAAKLEHSEANYRVALCSEMGIGTKRDLHRAVNYYKKAAKLGDTPSMYKLGVIQLYGELGVAPSPSDGIVMLKRAAANATAEHPHPVHELAMLYDPNADGGVRAMKHLDPKLLHEILSLVQPDAAYAIEMYTQSAALGYAPSQYRLGVCYQDGELNCHPNPKVSISYFTKAAEQGHPEAELALSGWYLEGAPGLLNSDDSQAFAWARKAADKGLFKAEYALGYYFEMGIGVNCNIDEARRFYQRAAAQGSRRAMERLTELNSGKRKKPPNPEQVKHEKSDCVLM